MILLPHAQKTVQHHQVTRLNDHEDGGDGTGGADDGGVKNPFAVTPNASTADPEPFLEAPRPIVMVPFLTVPNGPPFSIEMVDLARGLLLLALRAPSLYTPPVVCIDRATPGPSLSRSVGPCGGGLGAL